MNNNLQMAFPWIRVLSIVARWSQIAEGILQIIAEQFHGEVFRVHGHHDWLYKILQKN